jgi:hypothetical protein
MKPRIKLKLRSKVVSLVQQPVQDGVHEVIDHLIEMAKDKHIRELDVTYLKDGDRCFSRHSDTRDRYAAAGRLIAAALYRLKD